MHKRNYSSSTALRKRFVLGGTLMEQHLGAADTGHLFSLFENRAPASSRTPIHVHTQEDETFYMLEGEMTALVDGEQVLLRSGESILLPRHVPHQLLNRSGTSARYLLLCTPGGFEDFLAGAGTLLLPGAEPGLTSSEDITRLREAAPKFGITILREWPPKQASVPDDLG